MGEEIKSSTSDNEIWDAAESAISIFSCALYAAPPGTSRVDTLGAYFNEIERHLHDTQIDYSIQAYMWLSEEFYLLRREGDLQSIKAIWDWVKRTMKQEMNEEQRFALCFTFLFPLIDEPQDADVMKDVLALYSDEKTRPFLTEAYEHVKDPEALTKDLLVYQPVLTG